MCGALNSPHTITVGAELAGVHVLFGGRARRPGSYHIGAGGLFIEEVIVRTLAETAERYAQMTAAHFGAFDIKFQTYVEMQGSVASDSDLIPEDSLDLFDSTAFNKPNFPFAPFCANSPLGWVTMESMVGARPMAIPAQMVLVGYRTQRQLGERATFSSVTTGTAAHRTHDLALINGLLELIQIDAAVGHWYSGWPCDEIRLDERTRTLQGIVERHNNGRLSAPSTTFMYISNPDLPGFPIACVLRGPKGTSPEVAVGLGCALGLEEAMYKSWLEALGVWDLATINMIESSRRSPREMDQEKPRQIFDLDSNVAYYAEGHGSNVFADRFSPRSVLGASALGTDFVGSADDRIRYLVDAFRDSEKRLYRLDLTTRDVEELGFAIERVWSPDTLSLPLPSAQPTRHSRFIAYGGASNEYPHPYP